MLITLLFIIPIILSLILLIFNKRYLNIALLLLHSIIFFIISANLYYKIDYELSYYFKVDQTNNIFLFILSFVYLGSAIYNINFLRFSKYIVTNQTRYTVFLMLFVTAIFGATLSTHLGLFWVFIEATTLSSAYLIDFNRTKSSLEATWKYIFICSIGIALAYVGIILLSIGTTNFESLYFDDLYRNAKLINPFWLKLAFIFILIGFGSKVGLAPVHAWLPDAHSEAPTPISAMLSATLLNTAFLGIMRVYKILQIAESSLFAQKLLFFMGFASIFVTAVFAIRINNYKRLLAYSSIENMGIIAIALAIGGFLGSYALKIHLIAHSLTKAAFFLTAGNILHLYKTKDIDKVSGIIQNDKITGWLWIFCCLAIVGIPPFPIFLSEFLIILALLKSKSYLLVILFFLLLTIVMYGLSNSVLKMSFGKKLDIKPIEYNQIFDYLPQIIFLIALILITFKFLSNIPAIENFLLNEIAYN